MMHGSGWMILQAAPCRALEMAYAQASTLLTLQIGDTVTFSLLKRLRRGIIPQEVAGEALEDSEPTPAQEKVSLVWKDLTDMP